MLTFLSPMVKGMDSEASLFPAAPPLGELGELSLVFERYLESGDCEVKAADVQVTAASSDNTLAAAKFLAVRSPLTLHHFSFVDPAVSPLRLSRAES